MKEQEQFTNDPLESRIIERLGERQKKIDAMNEWERKSSASVRRLPPYYIIGTAVAACALAFFVLTPSRNGSVVLDELGIEYAAPEFRAGSADITAISRMIDAKEYDEALLKAKDLLDDSNKIIEEFDWCADFFEDEGLRYEMEVEKYTNSELQWMYIYLLVRTDDVKEAKKELKQYLKRKDFCDHRAEAEALLKELKK